MRIPLNPIDQGIFHLDQADMPWSLHCEVRVPGRLDDARVRAAASAATARHALARASLAAHRRRDRRLFWEVADRVDHVSVDVVDCPDDDRLNDVRARLLTVRVPLDAPPPFALTLAHRPGGDSLIMNLNHAIGDGLGAFRLMTSIARAYAGVEDGRHEADPFDARNLDVHLAPHAKRRDPAHAAQPSVGRTARVARDGGRSDVTGVGFCVMRLRPTIVAEIAARRCPPATLNDVLLASLAVAIRRFNDGHNARPATVSLTMPVNLRPAGSQEVLSNLVCSLPVAILVDEQVDLPTAQLAVARRTRAIKARRQRGGLIEMPPMIGGWPVGAVHFLTRMLVARRVATLLAGRLDTTGFSNLGRLGPPPDFGGLVGAATELWISAPAVMPTGVGVAGATMNDELFLTLRYCREQFDAPGAERFMATWRGVLLSG